MCFRLSDDMENYIYIIFIGSIVGSIFLHFMIDHLLWIKALI